MRQNRPIYSPPPRTHEGAIAARVNPVQALRRSVLFCLLWEKEFYESGESIADRIMGLCETVPAHVIAGLAVEARRDFNLRHVPLLLLCALQRRDPKLVRSTVGKVLRRADEPAELLAVYRSLKGNAKNIPHQMRLGIGDALRWFDEYQLAKYDRKGAFSLRDVFRICRPKPRHETEAGLWRRAVKGELATPDTWEVALSAGADKKETWERLLREEQLGYFALLRNLRNMVQVGVDEALVWRAILERGAGADKVLPFRFIAAARAAPMFERELDQAMVANLEYLPSLEGTTAILVDVSGSMDQKLSAKSDLTRVDAAAALGAIFPGRIRLFTFSNQLIEVPPRRGMAGVDAILRSQQHGLTYLGESVRTVQEQIPHDRMVVISDEQSHDRVPNGVGRSYMINVASAQHGVGYGSWTHIDGFSENVIRFIAEIEAGEGSL